MSYFTYMQHNILKNPVQKEEALFDFINLK